MEEKNKSDIGENNIQTGGDAELSCESVVVIDRVWKIAISGILFVLLFHQELSRLVSSWRNANESHGMLIPAFSLYFVYQERDYLRKTVGKPSYLGLLLIFLSLACYVWSIIGKIGYPRPIMMISALGGVVLLLGGWPIVRRVWLPVAFLVFAIKLPAGLHESITIPMRMWASAVASVILDFLPGVSSQSAGVLITGFHNGQKFDLNVAEACSGMRLLRTFVALGVAMAYMEYRPVVHRITLLASTVPIAIFCNMVRVLLTGVIHIFIGPEYAQGMMHTLFGLIMLLLAFGLYGALAWVMNNIYAEENSEDILIISKKDELNS